MDNKLSCLYYWQQRYQNIIPSLEFSAKTEAEFLSWQMKFRSKFEQCLQEMPITDVLLNVEVLETIETEEFTRKKIVYSADEYSIVPAYLFIPKSLRGPAPAIICPHGHGRGKNDPAGVVQEAWEVEHLKGYNYDYAVQFAQHGYVTLAPDSRCFGERVDDKEKVYGFMEIHEGDHWCDINFILGQLIGINLLTLHIFDIMRGIDFLCSMPEVDAERIGCVGLSQGGTTTLFSTAYDPRIKVAGVSGYLNSWKTFPLDKGQICGSQIVPGLLRYGDHAEVAGLICPRPVFFEFGINDPIFPIKASRATYKRVQEIYRVAGVPERVDAEEFEGVHEFRGQQIFDFFKKWL